MNVEFLQTLSYMLNGMAGIFFVTLVIMLCVTILNKVTQKRNPEDKKQ